MAFICFSLPHIYSIFAICFSSSAQTTARCCQLPNKYLLYILVFMQTYIRRCNCFERVRKRNFLHCSHFVSKQYLFHQIGFINKNENFHKLLYKCHRIKLNLYKKLRKQDFEILEFTFFSCIL